MRTKKLIAGLLATAMVITGISVAPKQEAEAAVATGIVYEVFDEMTIGEAPVFDGVEEGMGYSAPETYYTDSADGDYDEISDTAEYLFGGWYYIAESEDEDISVCPVTDDDSLVDDTGCYFAKWVPASLLSVKAQNHVGVASGDESAANIRVLSSVDSLDYEKVGFTIEINNNGSPLTNAAKGTTKVYDTLLADGKSYAPSTIFGAGAEYFVIWTLAGIPDAGDDDIIYVRPYWVTADGVRVEGLGKYVHVEDGYNKYVSVPVNLNMLSEDAVAAGVFEISYPDGLTLVEDKVEVGRVFGEMEFADKGSSVKFAANVADINSNATANDIYVNLRFTVDSGDVTHASYNFEIQDTPDFCDNTEAKVTIDIWDVLY